MGLKKYEIITVGSDKRVRALRSWQVQDRYVNIGDVGGIVYDEKTLSQDGACWLFRGNFNFPGARIGGDSIVDVGEAAPDATGSANLDILGTSTVVGAPVKFTVGLGAVDGLVLPASYFEQGGISYSAGTNWETWKAPSTQNVRLKAPIFMGGVAATLKVNVPGYTVQAFVMDRDGTGITATNSIQTGVGVTVSIPAGQYFMLRLAKNPAASIVPADATAAQITVTAVFETKLVVVDSRLELNPANGTGAISIRSGGLYSLTPGSKYPDSVIRDSKVVINSHATTARMIRMITEIMNSNATIDATTADAQAVGIYHGVNNLVFTGLIASNWDEAARSLIQAYNCDNMVVNTTNFPGIAAIQNAGVPVKFYGCNLNNARIYHHAQIANTYRDINFDLATADLGKTTANAKVFLVSSEVNGMYRTYATSQSMHGLLVESQESVKAMTPNNQANMYNSVVYADAYLNGLFDFAGTNVFGSAVKRPIVNTQNVFNSVIQGGLTLTANQPPAPNNSPNVVSTINPIRINGGNGFTVTLPKGLQARLIFIDARGIYVTASAWLGGVANVPTANLTAYGAFIMFQNTGGTAITPADVAGVTVTTYNGCKLVNTGATAVNMKGNIRVEDNAILVNAGVVGTGYFGGNSIAQGLTVEGTVYMKDNAVFAPTISGTPKANILQMTDNASFTGGWSGAGTRLTMSDNARYGSSTALNTLGVVEMRGNADISGSGTVSVSGVLVLQDDASITAGAASISGNITLCGKYKQTAAKTWTGKRVIDSQDAPQYDNNVKTKYDF